MSDPFLLSPGPLAATSWTTSERASCAPTRRGGGDGVGEVMGYEAAAWDMGAVDEAALSGEDKKVSWESTASTPAVTCLTKSTSDAATWPTKHDGRHRQRCADTLLDHSSRRKMARRGYIADRPERSHQLGLQLTPPRTSDAAFEVRGRQRRRRERRLTPLQRTTDRGRTGPPGTPAGNIGSNQDGTSTEKGGQSLAEVIAKKAAKVSKAFSAFVFKGCAEKTVRDVDPNEAETEDEEFTSPMSEPPTESPSLEHQGAPSAGGMTLLRTRVQIVYTEGGNDESGSEDESGEADKGCSSEDVVENSKRQLSEYEQLRLGRIARNKARLGSLGLQRWNRPRPSTVNQRGTKIARANMNKKKTAVEKIKLKQREVSTTS
ncbi:hypothetical protein THAOC_09786 [Thalassiosira oceanica]|uniref:Uncharacterized protein n=1 Tax=Thalassiosira oceanica TaxID=159749 RepID=K0SVK9_THAOC|nr:hypothetical protein THAOC_09786 [Thalassiosira oceanica]|eukprot:EJK68999.1 hypothetical protein THAOC_09786 [Thalassiosira oceanica]